MRLRLLVGIATSILIFAPANSRAEAFSSYWTTLSETERAFVDQVAAGMYSEERGRRIASYGHLNSASKARFRARAVEVLGVENRPARTRLKSKDI